MKLRAVAGVILGICLALFVANRVNAESLSAPSSVTQGKAFDLAFPQAVVNVGAFLAPHKVADPAASDSGWFTLTIQNGSASPVARVLIVQASASSALAFIPPPVRVGLVEVASSDQSVSIQRALVPRDKAFLVALPPGSTATLALHLEGFSSSEFPSLLAWNEAALIAHNRQVALLVGVVSGLLAAAAAFAAGTAVLSGHLYARWAAFFISAVLFAELTAAGVFDEGVMSRIGGPYALFAFALALLLAIAVRLTDCIASFAIFLRSVSMWRDSIALGILVTGIAALFSVPVAGFLLRLAALLGAVGGAFYIAQCGRAGIAAARRLTPAAVILALVAVAAAANALGLFGANLVASDSMGGFSAAAALLVALATAVPNNETRLRGLVNVSPSTALRIEYSNETITPSRDQAAIAASRQAVFDLRLESGRLRISSEAADILGLAPGTLEFERNIWLTWIYPEDREVFNRALDTYRSDPGVAFRLEFRVLTGGRRTWIELRATMIGDVSEAEYCLGLIADVTARKNTEGSGQRSNQIDLLTRFGNRSALISHIQALDHEFRRTVLVVFDLDRFKHVNANLGRAIGDRLLTALAARLEQCFAVEREAGHLAFFRIGGDMFAMLCVNAADLVQLGEQIVEVTRMPFDLGQREVYLPLSVGVASGANARDAENLLSQAELAMVEAKRQGGGRACLYSNALAKTKMDDPIALEADLRRAIERGEIEVHYQPIVRLNDLSLAGFEALLRWRHPARGLVEPDYFVPHAERSGLIVTLGGLALRNAVSDLAHWQTEFPMAPPLFVSVNVAWRQIAEKDFTKEVEGLLRGVPLAESTLKIELTETSVIARATKAEVTLTRLKAIGVGLSIDDFGTGHSSLSRLVRFPFDTVKIGKSFLAATDEKTGDAILSSIVGLAHELSLVVVAEGIESEADIARLAGIGCEFGQGFIFGHPLSKNEVDAFIATRLAQP